MKAYVKQIKGITFAGRADSNHWITMDGPVEFGGTKGANTPMELILMALGGCASMDIIPILQKKKVVLHGYEINLEGTRSEDHPKVFTKIHVEFVFYGKDISPAAIENAIELSFTKYCSVSAMLNKSVKITHSYRIEDSIS